MVLILYYFVLLGVLFVFGFIGVMICCMVIFIFLSVELMFNVVNIVLVVFVCLWGDLMG